LAPSVLSKAAIAVCALVTVVLGIFPQPVLDLADHAAQFVR
jgi:NADH-quinone oxidoreductase subunit N